METDKIKKEIENTELELEKTRELLKPIEKNILSLVKKREKLEEKLFEIEKKDAEANLDWEYILFDTFNIGEVRYDWREKIVKENTKSIKLNGYYRETNQAAIQIGSRDATLEEIVEDINKLLPYLKEIKGEKVINIFDEYLSEHGCYSLRFIENNVQIVQLYYGSENVLTTGDLTTCLKYIWEKLYFNRSEETEETYE